MLETTPVKEPKTNHAVPVPRPTVKAIANYAGTSIEAVLDRLTAVFTPELLQSIADQLKNEQADILSKNLKSALAGAPIPSSSEDLGVALVPSD